MHNFFIFFFKIYQTQCLDTCKVLSWPPVHIALTDKYYTYDESDVDQLTEAVESPPLGVLDVFDDGNKTEQYFTKLLLSICREYNMPNGQILVCHRDNACLTNHTQKP